MILPDINVLIHAHDAGFRAHAQMRDWWDQQLAGTEGIGLAWVVILGFVRVTTHRAIWDAPLTPDEATARIAEWLALPHVHIPIPSEGHFDRLRALLGALGTAGNLTTDAHLAALAQERGYTLVSTDADFARFPGLRWRNPLAG